MSLTLTLTDAADGTGFTAAVADTGGAAVTVYACRVTGEIGTAAFASAGTRTGDGSVTLALATGYYFAYAQTASARSDLVYGLATTGADAVQTRVRAAIVATLELLALPCTARVVARWSDRDQHNLDYPCVTVGTEGETDTPDYYGSSLDGYSRPTLVAIRDAADPQDAAAADTYELWRQRMMRAFHHQRLSGVTEVRYCTAEARPILEEERDRFQGVVSAFVVKAFTREPRGLGA